MCTLKFAEKMNTVIATIYICYHQETAMFALRLHNDKTKLNLDRPLNLKGTTQNKCALTRIQNILCFASSSAPQAHESYHVTRRGGICCYKGDN